MLKVEKEGAPGADDGAIVPDPTASLKEEENKAKGDTNSAAVDDDVDNADGDDDVSGTCHFIGGRRADDADWTHVCWMIMGDSTLPGNRLGHRNAVLQREIGNGFFGPRIADTAARNDRPHAEVCQVGWWHAWRHSRKPVGRSRHLLVQ